MDKELLDYVKEKTEELRTAPSCCRELRTAAVIAAHGYELKAKGVPYCDCRACAAAEAILDRKDELLGKA